MDPYEPMTPIVPCESCVVFAMCRSRGMEEEALHTNIFYIGLAQECPYLLKFITGGKISHEVYSEHRIHQCKELFDPAPKVIKVIKYRDERIERAKKVFR